MIDEITPAGWRWERQPDIGEYPYWKLYIGDKAIGSVSWGEDERGWLPIAMPFGCFQVVDSEDEAMEELIFWMKGWNYGWWEDWS